MSWLWRALTKNLLLKSSALVCAVVLWVYVDCTAEDQKTVTVQVRLLPDKGWEAYVVGGCLEPRNMTARSVDVTLRGRSIEVRAIVEGKLSGVLPVPAEGYEGVDGFNRSYELTPAHFTGLGGTDARIVKVSPSIISVAAVRSRKR